MSTEAKLDFNFTISAPGKVILFGEHSVVYKKAAVSTSISKRLYVTIRSCKENTVSINFPQINSYCVWSLDKFEKVIKERCPLENLNEEFGLHNPELIDHNRYVESLKCNLEYLGMNAADLQEENKTVVSIIGFLFLMRGMFHSLSSPLVSFSVEVTSELEVGAGTGSSAAFSVALSSAIFYLRKKIAFNSGLNTIKPLSSVKDNVIVKSNPQKSGFTLEEVRAFNKWAFCIEKIMHGRPSGIDNTTCTFGSVIVTSNQKTTGELIFRVLEHLPRVKLLLISSGVSRNTASLVAKVRHLRENNCAAVDSILNAMDVIAQEAFKTLEALGITNSNDSSIKNMELYRTLNVLMDLNHGLLRTLTVSHETLEHIVKVSNRHGLSSKLTGAGGGGYAITLVPPNFSQDQIDALSKDLEPLFSVTEVNIAQEGVRLENNLCE